MWSDDDDITHDPLRMRGDASPVMKQSALMSVCTVAINREWLDKFS
jgi:hypothetical protein